MFANAWSFMYNLQDPVTILQRSRSHTEVKGRRVIIYVVQLLYLQRIKIPWLLFLPDQNGIQHSEQISASYNFKVTLWSQRATKKFMFGL